MICYQIKFQLDFIYDGNIFNIAAFLHQNWKKKISILIMSNWLTLRVNKYIFSIFHSTILISSDNLRDLPIAYFVKLYFTEME